MSQPHPRERLRTETGATLAGIAATKARRPARDQPPRPGDLFVLPQTRELPVEWLVLRAGDGGRLLVVAADTYPAAGSSDVAVPVSAASGPLNLRCGFGRWLDAAVFDPELCTGTVEEIYLGHAHRKLLQLERGTATGSWTERQTDGDLAYRDWHRDVLAEALDRLGEKAAPSRAPVRLERRRRAWVAWVGMAAAATVVLALSVQVFELRRQNETLLQPGINPPSFNVDMLETTRSGESVREIPAGAVQAIFYLTPPSEPVYPTYRVEILDARGASVWQSPATPPHNGVELVLTVPTARLHTGRYRLHVEGRRAGSFEPVSDVPLLIQLAGR